MADEYISREAALKYIKSEQCKTCSDIGLCGNCAVLVAVKLLEKVPAADVAPVVRGTPITKIREVTITEYHEARGVFASDGSNVYIKNMVYAKVPYDHCPVCGAVLCSRWHNYCGKCGAKMDGGNKGE